MVFVMVAIGGATRLTGSGLSMVEWKPFTGWLPPLSEAAWQVLFDKYRQFPEYQKINAGMSLDEFKSIFWLEYIHRVWGRLIGIAFAVPFVWLLLRRAIPRPLVPHLVVLLLLGGMQGLLGWFMVKSGLVDHPDVSPYRLTAHLSLAMAIYAYLLWLALGLLRPAPSGDSAHLRPFALSAAGLVAITVVAGGFVAGTNAGFDYNSFPLMDGRWVPEAYGELSPWWRNAFESIATVQFHHRILATLTLAAALLLWWRATGHPARLSAGALFCAVAAQYALGVATLIYVVPVSLGVLHQSWALVVISAAVWVLHSIRAPKQVAARADNADYRSGTVETT